MQIVNLTQVIDPNNQTSVIVEVPDGFALAKMPKGRGSLACWLARLPNGSRLSGLDIFRPIPWRDEYRSCVELVKQDGQWIEADSPKQRSERDLAALRAAFA